LAPPRPRSDRGPGDPAIRGRGPHSPLPMAARLGNAHGAEPDSEALLPGSRDHFSSVPAASIAGSERDDRQRLLVLADEHGPRAGHLPNRDLSVRGSRAGFAPAV